MYSQLEFLNDIAVFNPMVLRENIVLYYDFGDCFNLQFNLFADCKFATCIN